MKEKNKPKTGKGKSSQFLKDIKQKISKSTSYQTPKKIVSRKSGTGG